MGIKKWQIKEWELYEIRVLLVEWYSVPYIADKIWRNKSTLYRLFQSNGVEYKERRLLYIWGKWWHPWFRDDWKRKIQLLPSQVHLQRKQRKSEWSKRYCRINPWWKLEWFILEKIKNYYSPKQISGKWKLETREKLSKDTIYRWVYSTHPELIKKYFRRKWKKYQHKRASKYQIMNRRMIDERPEIVNKRERIWDWEWDTVVWPKYWSKEVVLTNVERKSGYLISTKLKNWTAENVFNATKILFQDIPKDRKITMTYDNWREFAWHTLIEYTTKIMIYFAHPYHSWERWTNENTNGLLRQFFPKWTDFKNITEEELQYYVNIINHRPRERLWFLTPYEVFVERKEIKQKMKQKKIPLLNFFKSCVWL